MCQRKRKNRLKALYVIFTKKKRKNDKKYAQCVRNVLQNVCGCVILN